MMFWRWVKRTIYSLVALLLIVATTLTVLLTTQFGATITLAVVNPFIPGKIHYESMQGAFLRDFDMQGLQYENDEIYVAIEEINLRWRPWQLFRKQLHVRTLAVHGVVIHVPESEGSAEPGPIFPIELPDIHLPFEFRLDQSQLTNLQFVQGDNSTIIERALLRARTRGDTLHLYAFSVTTPEVHAQLHGTITPNGNYSLQLNTLVRFELPELGFTTVAGQLQGNIEQLQLRQQVSGIANADINVTVFEATQEKLRWEGLIRVLQSNPELIPGIDWVNASLQGQGTLHSVEGDFRIEGRHQEHGNFVIRSEAAYKDEEFSLDTLFARADDIGLMIDLSGAATVQPAEDISATQIDFNMGGLMRYQDYLDGEISLSLIGTPSAVEQLHLSAKSFAATLKLTGGAAWEEKVTWDLQLVVENLELDRILANTTLAADYQGVLNATIHSAGRWHEQPEFNVTIAQLSGRLNEQDLHVSAAASLRGEQIQLASFTGQWGTQQLTASGAANVASEQFNVALNGSQLEYGPWALEQIAADLAGDWALNSLPTGTLTLTNLSQNEQQLVADLQVSMRHSEPSDTASNHYLELSGNAFASEFAVVLNGMWSAFQWQGDITQLSVAHEEFEPWRLTESASANVGAEKIQVDHFCIENEQRVAGFCLAVDWDLITQLGEVNARAESIQLALLQPALDAIFVEDFEIAGELNATVDLLITENQLQVDTRVLLSETLFALPQQDLQFQFNASELLRITGDQHELHSTFALNSADLNGGITGELTLRDALDSAAINGFFNIQLDALGIISIIVPELQAVQGQVAGQIDISGNLPQPSLFGYVELLEGGAEVPAAGITISALNMRLDAPNAAGEPFSLNATAISGDGELTIAGEYYLAEQRALVNITGNDFRALQTRDIQLTISPNIEVSYDPSGVRARGEITVPNALITPPDIQTIDSASRDTVIVRGDETVLAFEESELPIDADIQMILGNNVRVEAFGFDGRLTGRLRVREQPGQQTSAVGTITVASGRYEIFGQPLDIERGNFTYTGGAIDNPGLDLRVSRSISTENVTVGARIGGALREPTLSFFSTPAMQDSAILSYLILGRAPGMESGEENVFAQATLALGMQGGNFIGEQIGQAIGVDEIVLDSTGENFDNAALYIGKHLSSRLYVKYGIGLIEPVNTLFIRYRLTDNIHFESQSGGDRSGADIFYSIER